MYKNYLEEFYSFVTKHPDLKGSPRSEVMAEILEFEADLRSINITLNSFGTELSKSDRNRLYPSFGRLYPEGTLMLSRADDIEGVSLACSGVQDFKSLFDNVGMSSGGNDEPGLGNMSSGLNEGKSLEDMFYQKKCEMAKLAFTNQFTMATVYSWVRLGVQVGIFKI